MTPRPEPHHASTRRWWLATLDTLLLVGYIALQEPGGATGFVVHEWLGLAFIPLTILHVVVSWRWIRSTWHRVRFDPKARDRINFLLNAALFVMMLVIIVSGLVISEYALPALGLTPQGSQRWEQLHNFTSSLIIPVVALHLALNWHWIAQTLRRLRPRGT